MTQGGYFPIFKEGCYCVFVVVVITINLTRFGCCCWFWFPITPQLETGVEPGVSILYT